MGPLPPTAAPDNYLSGGGGGGGRIAIYPSTSQFTGNISAYGGAGFMAGGAGTIYSVYPVPASGFIAQLLVDNGGQRGTNTTLGNMTGTFDLIITNGAALVPSGTTSIVMRNLYIAANSFLTINSTCDELCNSPRPATPRFNLAEAS